MPGMFMSELIVSPVPMRARFWRLWSSLVFICEDGRVIDVPPDYETDLASIPAFIRGAIPVNGLHREAAALHDFLYSTQGYTRAEADGIFHEAMIACGVGEFKARIFYWGVRAGGWLRWYSVAGNSK